MKNKLRYLLLAVLILGGIFASGCNLTGGSAVTSKYTQDASNAVAEDWVKHNSPTFVFDGSNLQFMQSTSLRCQYTWMYEFRFNSANSGYGNRKGKAPNGQKTNHIIQVVVQKNKIIAAVADDQYDELNNKPGETIVVDQIERSCL